MAQELFDVNTLKIAKPCTARWSEMEGDERARFCGQCKKSVYNVAGMTRLEVSELIQSSRTMPCMRLRRRADGTVMTGDCPVGQRTIWKRVFVVSLVAAGVFLSSVGLTKRLESMRAANGAEPENLVDVARHVPILGGAINVLWPVSPPPPVTLPVAVPTHETVLMGVIELP
ncbi:MAG: hypothetical protein IH944_10385 [Armatimonadetes bacterium]|nr:hypothetical protein [Armatimonadota bacterium]